METELNPLLIPEMAGEIFCWVDGKSLGAAAQVCKLWERQAGTERDQRLQLLKIALGQEQEKQIKIVPLYASSPRELWPDSSLYPFESVPGLPEALLHNFQNVGHIQVDAYASSIPFATAFFDQIASGALTPASVQINCFGPLPKPVLNAFCRALHSPDSAVLNYLVMQLSGTAEEFDKQYHRHQQYF